MSDIADSGTIDPDLRQAAIASSGVVRLTPDNVSTVLPDLPRSVRLAFNFGSRLRRGTLDVTLPTGGG